MTEPTSTVRTTVHVMRHGEVFNPEKVLYGRLPGYHLSERGRAQAQRCCRLAGRQGHRLRGGLTVGAGSGNGHADRRKPRAADRHRRAT